MDDFKRVGVQVSDPLVGTLSFCVCVCTQVDEAAVISKIWLNATHFKTPILHRYLYDCFKNKKLFGYFDEALTLKRRPSVPHTALFRCGEGLNCGDHLK